MPCQSPDPAQQIGAHQQERGGTEIDVSQEIRFRCQRRGITQIAECGAVAPDNAAGRFKPPMRAQQLAANRADAPIGFQPLQRRGERARGKLHHAVHEQNGIRAGTVQRCIGAADEIELGRETQHARAAHETADPLRVVRRAGINQDQLDIAGQARTQRAKRHQRQRKPIAQQQDHTDGGRARAGEIQHRPRAARQEIVRTVKVERGGLPLDGLVLRGPRRQGLPSPYRQVMREGVTRTTGIQIAPHRGMRRKVILQLDRRAR